MSEKIKVTFHIELEDGTAECLVYEIAAPDWPEISAGSLDELAAIGMPNMIEEMQRRDAAAAIFCEPLERQFRSFMRRFARDARAAIPYTRGVH